MLRKKLVINLGIGRDWIFESEKLNEDLSLICFTEQKSNGSRVFVSEQVLPIDDLRKLRKLIDDTIIGMASEST